MENVSDPLLLRLLELEQKDSKLTVPERAEYNNLLNVFQGTDILLFDKEYSDSVFATMPWNVFAQHLSITPKYLQLMEGQNLIYATDILKLRWVDDFTYPIWNKIRGWQEYIRENAYSNDNGSESLNDSGNSVPKYPLEESDPLLKVDLDFIINFFHITPGYSDILYNCNVLDIPSFLTLTNADGAFSTHKWKKIEEWKERLLAEKETIVNSWNEAQERKRVYELPILNEQERNLSLHDRLNLALRQAVEHLKQVEDRCKDDYVLVLEKYILAGMEQAQVRDSFPNFNNTTTLTNKFRDIRDGLLRLSTTPLCGKVWFSEDFCSELQAFRSDVLYKDTSEFNIAYGVDANYEVKGCPVYRLLELETTTPNTRSSATDQIFIVNKNEVGLINTYIDYIYRALVSNPPSNSKDYNTCVDPNPKSFEEICDFFDKNYSDFEYDTSILLTLLDAYNKVECVVVDGDTLYQVKYHTLSSVIDKIARILYSHEGEFLTPTELIEKDLELGHGEDHDEFCNRANDKDFLTRLNDKYNNNFTSHGDEYGYIPNQSTNKMSMRSVVLQYVQTKGNATFTYDDVVQELENKGFTITKEDRRQIRIYITILAVCAVDNVDLFMAKEYAKGNAGFMSRIDSVGSTWMDKRMVEILLEQPGKRMNKYELTKQLNKDKKQFGYSATPYNAIRKYTRPLPAVDGKSLLTWEDDENVVKLNEEYYEEYGLTIVSKNDTLDLLTDVYKFLSDQKDNTALLTDIQDHCRPLYKGYCKDQSFYNLINRLLGRGIEKIKDNGHVYLRLVKENIEQVVAPVNSVPDVILNPKWDNVEGLMKEGLMPFYTKISNYDSKIRNFVHFMSEYVINEHLSTFFPYHVWKYFKGGLTEYDLYDIFKGLVNYFEGVVKEIYLANKGYKMPQTKGLRETVSHLFKMDNWIQANWNNRSNTFVQIYRDLCNTRNHVDHCEPIGKGIEEYKKCIVEYMALCVYVVNEYVDENVVIANGKGYA